MPVKERAWSLYASASSPLRSASAWIFESGLGSAVCASERLASPSELLTSPSELLASPSELLASPSELSA
jgi:hypothetical protein